MYSVYIHVVVNGYPAVDIACYGGCKHIANKEQLCSALKFRCIFLMGGTIDAKSAVRLTQRFNCNYLSGVKRGAKS